ncbi:MAG: hypothetical protein RDV48_18270 [Candidatus Eremiobacteraeota bacterium]|nr:hypothetical protein [Candidatus Eremiobacteraeota bacterium]
MSVHPRDNQILYCVGHGGVHKSVDGAAHWKAIHSQEMQGSFFSFAFHPDDGEHLFTASNRLGIFESLDGGEHWRKMNEGFPGNLSGGGEKICPPVSSLAFDGEKNLYAALCMGEQARVKGTVAPVLRYDSGSKRWTPLGKGLPAAEEKPRALVARGADGKIWLSLYGKGCFLLEKGTWCEAGPPRSKVTFLNPSPARADEAYIGTQDDWVYRTKNGGKNWERLPLPAELRQSAVLPLVYNLAVDPNNADLIVIGCNAAGGSTEQPFFNPLPSQKAPAGTIIYYAGSSTYRPLNFRRGVYYGGFRNTPDRASGLYDDPLAGKRTKVYYRTGGGLACVIKLTDKGSSLAINGINGVYTNALFIDERGTFFAAGEEGILAKRAGDDEFLYVKPAKTLLYTWCFARDYSRDGAFYYGTGYPAWSWPESRGIYRLELSWMKPLSQLAQSEKRSSFQQVLGNTGIWKLLTFKEKPGLIIAGTQDKGVMISDDGGKSFRQMSRGLSEKSVCALWAARQGKTLLAGTRESDGNPLEKHSWHPVPGEKGNLYILDEKRGQWTPSILRKAVFSIAACGDTILCATSTGPYLSRDGGRTWGKSSRGLPSSPRCVDIKCTEGKQPRFYAGLSAQGIFRSDDRGESWQDITGDLPNKFIDELLIDPHDARVIYAATLGGSAFRMTDE